jgi:hypothetical protein
VPFVVEVDTNLPSETVDVIMDRTGIVMIKVGISIDLGSGGRRTFDPVANGTWTVTATVCGVTKTATITLP